MNTLQQMIFAYIQASPRGVVLTGDPPEHFLRELDVLVGNGTVLKTPRVGKSAVYSVPRVDPAVN